MLAAKNTEKSFPLNQHKIIYWLVRRDNKMFNAYNFQLLAKTNSAEEKKMQILHQKCAKQKPEQTMSKNI